MTKNRFEIIFWSFFVKTFTGLGQKQVLVKIHKNAQFLQNKVWKNINKNKFPTKYKMVTVYGFHIDFQCQVQMSLPRDLQMDIASPLLWNGLALCLWDFWSRFLYPANVYSYTHLQKHVHFSFDLFIFKKTTLPGVVHILHYKIFTFFYPPPSTHVIRCNSWTPFLCFVALPRPPFTLWLVLAKLVYQKEAYFCNVDIILIIVLSLVSLLLWSNISAALPLYTLANA